MPLLLISAACSEQTSEPASAPATLEPTAAPANTIPGLPNLRQIPLSERFDAAGRFKLDPKVLPAYRDMNAFKALKGDQYDDVRFTNPENYALTVPPTADVRPMVEWEPMRSIVMSFPGYFLQSSNATNTFVQVAKEAAAVGEVWFFVDGNTAETGLKNLILQAGLDQTTMDAKVKFQTVNMDSIWFIDSGPLPIIDKDTNTFAFADFRYYHERALDDGVPTLMGRQMIDFGYPEVTNTYRMPLSTEGGTFQSTTDGICFTGNRQLYYMSCEAGGCDESIRTMSLENVQNNPFAVEMRQVLADYVGCVDLIITNSITDDGTGHIDMYMKVLDDNRVLMGDYPEPYANPQQELNAARMTANADFIEAYVKPDGTNFTVERLVMPGHQNAQGGAIPFTYINSTFINGLNLWPATQFPEWNDSRAEAEAKWQEVMPEMDHVWIDSTELSFYSGAIHCVTRTIPAVEAGNWIEDGACASGTCNAPTGGYDGLCDPANINNDICWGPAWECGCNDCTTNCEYTPTEDNCNGITFTGCCEAGTAVWCQEGQLMEQACPNGCGWDSNENWYFCDNDGVTDPSGTFARSCGADCSCDGKECGDDGCGGDCGSCAGEAACLNNECREDCFDCNPGEIGCDGTVAWLCIPGTGGCNQRQTVDCGVTGATCEAGDCIAPPVVEPDPEPDVMETDTNTDEDTSVNSDDSVGEEDTGSDGGGSKDSGGCATGGAGGPWLALAACLLLGLRRSREGTVV